MEDKSKEKIGNEDPKAIADAQAYGDSGDDQEADAVMAHDPYDLTRIIANGKTLTKFDIWERKLLDFSLRNALLNTSLRRRALQLLSFDILRLADSIQNGKEYRIAPRPRLDPPLEVAAGIVSSGLYGELDAVITRDMEHLHLLHTLLPSDETWTILKNTYRAARNSIEESGANSLFLALGMLRWYETEKSEAPRYAPILLMPVEMVYKKGHYHIRTRDDEMTLNITLMEFLRQNFDIDIKGLDPLPLGAGGIDVPLIFSAFRDAVGCMERWDVEDECVLGIFSFSKFLMWSDVHNHRDQLAANGIIGSLVANRLTWSPQSIMASDLRDIDRNVPPIETAIPVDVDSSQMAAVIEGGAGNSFILYGPPGTGKSQTITNLIANALYHGKRVLFVAEKMAALSVVQRRLEKIGLDPFCLELHSNKSTKRHVLQQLDKALKVAHSKSTNAFAKKAGSVFEKRRELLAYIEALHAPDAADGLSPYDCILRAESIEAEPLAGFEFDPAIDAFMAKEGIKGIEELLGMRLPAVMRLVGQPAAHPLNGLSVDRAMVMDSDRIAKEMTADAEALRKYLEEADGLRDADSLRRKLLRDNSPALLDEDPEELRMEWRKAVSRWWVARSFAKNAFLRKLRRFNPFLTMSEIEPLISDLDSYRFMHARITDCNGILMRRFGNEYGEDEVPSSDYIARMAGLLKQWGEHSSEMRDWLHWTELSGQLRRDGMGSAVEALEKEGLDPASVKDAFLKALFLHKAKEKIRASSTLALFEGLLFDAKIASYRKLTKDFQQLTRKELRARLAAGVPRATDSAESASELSLLNRNICNGGRGLSLRDLFDQLPTLLPKLCPVMLMSPMSVAKYIDIGADRFDLVVFDEASQMPTSEAVGAIARGKSLIVVGDPKQMPPTNFFLTSNVDVEEVAIDDMESILEDCRTLEMPSLQLSWHYRSRHESLIAFSNNEYYDGSLITFPSVDANTSRVHYVHVEGGRYEKGTRRCNQAEAEAIVDEIVRRLRSERLRALSIGVIAFSLPQQSLIEDLLQERIERDKGLQAAANGLYEPIFVKNLENVQGDERDVILFSIGYGPDEEGKVSMNFGPLNNAGGERRLNVAVTRARREMYVFSTLRSADIDLRRSKAKGVEGLKHFLNYAETQSLPDTSQTARQSQPSMIAEHIAGQLDKLGYKAATNVGRSRFRVDVAVESRENPGRFILGILLDGIGYRDTLTTRDREVVQPSVLEGLDWKVMRIWSVDWFHNKERVMERIVERLEEIDDQPQDVTEVSEVPDVTVEAEEPEQQEEEQEQEPEIPTNAKEYVRYKAPMREALHIPKEDLIRNIIACEQPLTFTTLCQRASAIRGSRVGSTLIRTLKELSDRYYTDPSGAIWLSEEDSRTYIYYRIHSGRELADIPEAELRNVLAETLSIHRILDEGDLVVIASNKMGITRVGPHVEAAFLNALDAMKRDGEVDVDGNNVFLRFKGLGVKV